MAYIVHPMSRRHDHIQTHRQETLLLTHLVSSAWSIAKGHVVIPKSKSPERLAANLAGDFKLSHEEIQNIDGLDQKLRFNDPSKSFGYEFYTDLDGKV